MDELELLVLETYRHFNEHFSDLGQIDQEDQGAQFSDGSPMAELASGPGVLYHLQKSSSIFVIRTFVSQNVKEDHQRILKNPEDFPSLRLLEGGAENIGNKLRFFLVENTHQAEIIHDQLNNRRFPMDEERICNLSDPGFSWWLTTKGSGFQLSFTLSVSLDQSTIKLGPLGDRELALKNFQVLEGLINDAGLSLQMQNEMNRVQFTEGEDFLMEELKDLFEFGIISETMTDLFKLLAKRVTDASPLETSWFYLQEIAAMRRFWIQLQYDLSAD